MTPRLFVRKVARADMAEAFTWYEGRRTGLGQEFLDEVSVMLAAVEAQSRRFVRALHKTGDRGNCVGSESCFPALLTTDSSIWCIQQSTLPA